MPVDLQAFRNLVDNLHMAKEDAKELLKVADALEELRRENEELCDELLELGEMDE